MQEHVAEAGAAEQVPCEAGTYAAGRGSSTCTAANAGSFVKDQGADKEEKCAKGTFSSAPGSKAALELGRRRDQLREEENSPRRVI